MPDPLAALDPLLLAPQAGGGGSFGGGGGGGGGMGGGGDGIGAILYLLVRLALAYPAIGVPLLVGVGVVFVVGTQRGWWKHQERVIRRARPQRRALAAARSAAALKQRDPDFDEERFLERVERAFRVAQSSWCAQDLEPLRPFVSDGVFERFSLQVEEQIADRWRQGMEEVRVQGLSIAHVEPGAHFDTVTVRIPFHARIDRRDRETGKPVPGSELPRRIFAEHWSFVRRRGARSLTGEGLIEGKCPNCAAPLAVRRSARCESCEALVRSGQFDWVLTEITQASEWRPEREDRVVGLARYLERDPGLSVQLLEDRASVAFWRHASAERAGEIAPLTRVATEGYGRRFAERLAAAGTPRTITSDRAVGSVRTLGVLAGSETDRAVVEIVWDGRRARVHEDGRRELEDRRRLSRTLFVLARPAGATTRLEDAFATTHCRTCGARDPGGTDPACDYCGTPRTGDDSTWLLADAFDLGTPEARALQGELEEAARAPGPAVHGAEVPRGSGSAAAAAGGGAPAAVGSAGAAGVHHPATGADTAAGAGRAPSGTPPGGAAESVASGRHADVSAEGLLVWAVAALESDGAIGKREHRALLSLAERLEVPPERLEELAAEVRETGAVHRPRDADEARAWLGELAELALADGSLARREERFLEHAAKTLGLRSALGPALRFARRNLYRESRAARHEA